MWPAWQHLGNCPTSSPRILPRTLMARTRPAPTLASDSVLDPFQDSTPTDSPGTGHLLPLPDKCPVENLKILFRCKSISSTYPCHCLGLVKKAPCMTLDAKLLWHDMTLDQKLLWHDMTLDANVSPHSSALHNANVLLKFWIGENFESTLWQNLF